VDYTLSLSDGTVYQTSVGNQPLEFVIGGGNYLPDFEAAIVGMKAGESKTITILAADAYGERNFTFDRNQLGAGLDPKVGDYLTITEMSGQTRQVVVTSVTETTIMANSIHPLAGEDLTFKIDLLKIN
jgi:peptidylprolyl isomerase